jgi:Spy/CpxP family protein refolding chaperone
MTTLKTMMLALVAGSLAIGAGGVAFADAGKTFDPARMQQHVEKRVDKALNGTDATAEQKKQVAGIVAKAFTDLRALRDEKAANRKSMQEALQAPTIDPARIEAIRVEQMKMADATSKRFTQALTDAGNVLSASQRQAFFKAWDADHGHHGKPGKRG